MKRTEMVDNIQNQVGIFPGGGAAPGFNQAIAGAFGQAAQAPAYGGASNVKPLPALLAAEVQAKGISDWSGYGAAMATAHL